MCTLDAFSAEKQEVIFKLLDFIIRQSYTTKLLNRIRYRVFNRHWYLALQLFPSSLGTAALSTFILFLICDSMKYMANQKVYLMWSNYWDQIILNGIIPISSLVYFNSRFSLFTQFENFGNTFYLWSGSFYINISKYWRGMNS